MRLIRLLNDSRTACSRSANRTIRGRSQSSFRPRTQAYTLPVQPPSLSMSFAPRSAGLTPAGIGAMMRRSTAPTDYGARHKEEGPWPCSDTRRRVRCSFSRRACLFQAPRPPSRRPKRRAPDGMGRPGSEGVWDFRTLTSFERPEALPTRRFTPEEAAQFEADRLAAFGCARPGAGRRRGQLQPVLVRPRQGSARPGRRPVGTRTRRAPRAAPGPRTRRRAAGGSKAGAGRVTGTRRPPAAGSRTSGPACSRCAASLASTPARP